MAVTSFNQGRGSPPGLDMAGWNGGFWLAVVGDGRRSLDMAGVMALIGLDIAGDGGNLGICRQCRLGVWTSIASAEFGCEGLSAVSIWALCAGEQCRSGIRGLAGRVCWEYGPGVLGLVGSADLGCGGWSDVGFVGNAHLCFGIGRQGSGASQLMPVWVLEAGCHCHSCVWFGRQCRSGPKGLRRHCRSAL